MSHQITSSVSPDLQFSMGQTNYMLYLYGSLDALDKISEHQWSGNGDSRQYSRQDIKNALRKLEYLHGEPDNDFYGDWEHPIKEPVTEIIGMSSVTWNPPDDRNEAYQQVKGFLESILRSMGKVVKIRFA